MYEPPGDRTVMLCERDIQDFFNHQGIWEDAQAGKYEMRVSRQSPVKEDKVDPRTGHRIPKGAIGQICRYFMPGKPDEQVALCHRFLLADGSIGASGKPDPKVVVYWGVRFQKRDAPKQGQR